MNIWKTGEMDKTVALPRRISGNSRSDSQDRSAKCYSWKNKKIKNPFLGFGNISIVCKTCEISGPHYLALVRPQLIYWIHFKNERNKLETFQRSVKEWLRELSKFRLEKRRLRMQGGMTAVFKYFNGCYREGGELLFFLATMGKDMRKLV